MYAKVFQSIYDGSLEGNWKALVTFQQMLVLADRHGIVDMTHEAISRRTSIPLEIIEDGIADLERPDELSRTPNEDGKRLIRLDDHRDWGWQITNYQHYRDIRTAEERREYQREYKRKQRQQQKVDSQQLSTKSTNAEAEADTDTKADTVLEGRAREGNGKAKPRPKRRCPKDFEITPEMSQWAKENCPGVNVMQATAAFKDHTFAASKTDWIATWRNWMRREKPPRKTKYEESMARLEAWEPTELTNPLLLDGKL